MSTKYGSVRGFFVGKLRGYAVLAVTTFMLISPAIIKADTVPAITPHNGAYNPLALAGATIVPATATVGSVKASLPPMGLTSVWITAYASVPEETSDHPFITASGAHVRDGIVAANFLPFGTQIKIPALFGNKIFVVRDRMNTKFNERVDIWMPSVQKAVNFGIRHAAIVIIGPEPLAVKK